MNSIIWEGGVFLTNVLKKTVFIEKDQRQHLCYNSVPHTVLALPSCNVGLQYYSLHFTQTAIKTIMVHLIPPCNFVNCFVHDILITRKFSSIRVLV